MKTYPTRTANQNVPANVFLLAETSMMSGEIITTYYIDSELNICKVTDWKGDKPQPAMQFEAARLTGDSLPMIEHRVAQYYNRLDLLSN